MRCFREVSRPAKVEVVLELNFSYSTARLVPQFIGAHQTLAKRLGSYGICSFLFRIYSDQISPLDSHASSVLQI